MSSGVCGAVRCDKIVLGGAVEKSLELLDTCLNERLILFESGWDCITTRVNAIHFESVQITCCCENFQLYIIVRM